MTTTVGTAAGVSLSSLNTSNVPAGDICHFFCDDVKAKLIIKDKPTHYANELSNAVTLKQQYWECTITNAIISDNTMKKLNSYEALMKAWSLASTSIYFFCKDAATYMDFIIGTTANDWLACRIVGDITFGLSHGKKTISFKVEGCS